MWWIPVAVFGLALLASSWFWFFDHSWRDRWAATNLQAEQVALNKRQGYKVVAYLSLTDGISLGPSSKQQTNIVQVGKTYTEAGLRYQPVKITEPSGLETEFGYSLLYAGSSWQQGSITEFAGLDGKPVHIQTALENASIRKTVMRSARVMCLGFASSDRNFTAGENEALSDDRAINLCEALVTLGYVSEERGQEAIAVGFGEATTSRDAITDTARERPALVIGIVSAPRKPTPQALLNAIRHATRDSEDATFDWKIFSRYNQRIQGFIVNKADGTYSGYKNDEKWQSVPPLYSDIEPISPIAAMPTPGTDTGDED